MHTARDIPSEETVTLNLCVYRTERLPDHEWLAQRVHCTDVEGTHCKITIFNDDSLAGYEFTENKWYQIGPCPTDIYGGALGIKVRSTTEVTPIDAVEPITHPGFELDSPSVVQLAGSDGRVGIDIETITTVPEAEIEAYKDANSGDVNPEHYELVAVGIGYQPRAGEPISTDVILRADSTAVDEFRVIEAVGEYVQESDATTLLTFGGTWFDLPVLRGRAEIAGKAAAVDDDRIDRVHQTLEQHYHADLKQGVYRVFDGGSLEATAAQVGTEPPETYWDVYRHDLDPTGARESFDDGPWETPEDPVFYNMDMLFFGQHFLDPRSDPPESVSRRALTKLLTEYTRTDIAPMFHIADDDRFEGVATWPMRADSWDSA